MRQIKFRAWIYTDLRNFMIYSKELGDFFDHKIYGFKHELMQFTGLHDKDGTEIYEGDKIQYEAYDESEIGIVSFEDAHFMVIVDDERYSLSIYDLEYTTVIGNIYE